MPVRRGRGSIRGPALVVMHLCGREGPRPRAIRCRVAPSRHGRNAGRFYKPGRSAVCERQAPVSALRVPNPPADPEAASFRLYIGPLMSRRRVATGSTEGDPTPFGFGNDRDRKLRCSRTGTAVAARRRGAGDQGRQIRVDLVLGRSCTSFGGAGWRRLRPVGADQRKVTGCQAYLLNRFPINLDRFGV